MGKRPRGSPGKPLPVPQKTRRIHMLAVATVWALALLAYSNSFGNRLIFDSNVAILQDPRVWASSAENLKSILTHDYWYADRSTGTFRPLTKLSYMFNYDILGSGPNPETYHWVNFALHAANIFLVYELGLVVFDDFRLAWALAAIWGLHPVLTESVTNVVGRADLLAAFGVLTGLHCHIRAAAAVAWRKARWLFALAVAASIGLLSKENAIVLVAVMFAFDLTWRRFPWRARAAGYAVLALPVSLFFYWRAQVAAPLIRLIPGFVENPLSGADFWTARLTALKVIGKCIWLLLWPAQLSPDYSFRQIPLFSWRLNNLDDWKVAAAAVLCVAIAAIALFAYRRWKPVFFFIVFFFVCLAPTANVVIIIGSIMAERFLYLPSIGFAGCAVAALYALTQRLREGSHASRLAGPVLLGLICTAFAARTFARNSDWSDELSLWESAVKAVPDSYMSHYGLAATLAGTRGADPEAVTRELDRSLAILASVPDRRKPVTVYDVAGSWLLARSHGDSTSDRRALSILLQGERSDRLQNEETRRLNREHGKIVPYYSSAPGLYLDLGRAYLRLSQPREALEALQYGRLLSQQPDFSLQMADAFRALGEKADAASALLEGSMLTPGQNVFLARLVALYKDVDPQGCEVVNGVIETVNPNCAPVRSAMCMASRNVTRLYREIGKNAEADRTRNDAARRGCAIP